MPKKLTVAQIARELEIDRSTVLKWIQSDLLPAGRKGPGLTSPYYVTRPDLDAFVAKHLERPASSP